MSTDEMRIAIATIVGWKQGPPRRNFGAIVNATWEKVDDLPDFCNDLNLMHDLEKRMNASQWVEYRLNLTEICTKYRLPDWQGFAINATAHERARAWLKTVS